MKITPNARLVLAIALPALFGGAAASFSIYYHSFYGGALFFAVPFAIGWMSVAILRTRGSATLRHCLYVATVAAGFLSIGFLVLGLEGIICILLAVPLALPLVAAGAVAAWFALHRRSLEPGSSSVAIAALAIGLTALEPRLCRDVNGVVADSVVVQATPQETWSTIVRLDRVPKPHDWVYRAGIACPQQARIIKPAVGGLRVCSLSTGVLIEQIDVWKPGEMLRWRSLAVPPPMRETNPFHAEVEPPHLRREFYESPRGEFALSPVADRATTLTRRTWYRHRLHPAWYWNFWCELAISRIHRTVLDQVRIAAGNRNEV